MVFPKSAAPFTSCKSPSPKACHVLRHQPRSAHKCGMKYHSECKEASCRCSHRKEANAADARPTALTQKPPPKSCKSCKSCLKNRQNISVKSVINLLDFQSLSLYNTHRTYRIARSMAAGRCLLVIPSMADESATRPSHKPGIAQ